MHKHVDADIDIDWICPCGSNGGHKHKHKKSTRSVPISDFRCESPLASQTASVISFHPHGQVCTCLSSFPKEYLRASARALRRLCESKLASRSEAENPLGTTQAFHYWAERTSSASIVGSTLASSPPTSWMLQVQSED